MDYEIKPRGMISGQGEAQARAYRMYVGINGHAYFIADVENAADHIYVTSSPDWMKRGEGFGGATLNLEILNGKSVARDLHYQKNLDEVLYLDTDTDKWYFKLRGGWHTNSESAFRELRATNADALFVNTDPVVDIRQTHRTFVVIAEGKEGDLRNTVLKNVLYIDPEGGRLGYFDRNRDIADGIARALGKPVVVYRESAGGSMLGWHK